MALRDPLDADTVRARLVDRPGWEGDTSRITRTYRIGYDDAIQAVAGIGQAAIELEHRPDLDIRWDTLTVTMTTHTAGDVVTQLDFELVDRIDEITSRHGAS